MIISLEDSVLQLGKWYSGIISFTESHNGKLIIHIVFRKESDTDYVKIIPISNKRNSELADLAHKLDLFNAAGDIDTSYMDNLPVKAVLRKSSNGQVYVSKIKLDAKALQIEAEATENE